MTVLARIVFGIDSGNRFMVAQETTHRVHKFGNHIDGSGNGIRTRITQLERLVS